MLFLSSTPGAALFGIQSLDLGHSRLFETLLFKITWSRVYLAIFREPAFF